MHGKWLEMCLDRKKMVRHVRGHGPCGHDGHDQKPRIIMIIDGNGTCGREVVRNPEKWLEITKMWLEITKMWLEIRKSG